jgi:hypothetical protein
MARYQLQRLTAKRTNQQRWNPGYAQSDWKDLQHTIPLLAAGLIVVRSQRWPQPSGLLLLTTGYKATVWANLCPDRIKITTRSRRRFGLPRGRQIGPDALDCRPRPAVWQPPKSDSGVRCALSDSATVTDLRFLAQSKNCIETRVPGAVTFACRALCKYRP